MKTAALILGLLVSAAPALLAQNPIPTQYRYPNIGTPAPQSTFTAATTGDLTGYFVNANAGGQDLVRLFDVTTGYTSPFGLSNFTSSVGQSFDFGHVNTGDVLVFELENLGPAIPPGYYLEASNAAYSTDSTNHVYAQNIPGGTLNLGLPNSVLLQFEDLPNIYDAFGNRVTDFDYNDTAIAVTGVSIASTPEPGSLVLLGTGVLGLAGAVRRRLSV